jgi:cytochrome c oxidase assembly factor CtaG
MSAKQFLISGWSWNPTAITAAAMALAVFWIFGRDRRRIGYLISAVALFLLALVSPLNALADGYLFSAHMLQHILLLLIVPALAVLALPRDFVLPGKVSALTHPFLGWLAGVGSMWIWHAPALCNAAVNSRPVYAAQTISLLALGSVFWWQVIAPREEDRLSPPAAVVYLFTACTACSVLGMILTFSPVTVCPVYMHVQDRFGLLETIRRDWGMTSEKDQQIGGLLMWAPMCVVYLVAILAQLARWFSPSRKEGYAQ